MLRMKLGRSREDRIINSVTAVLDVYKRQDRRSKLLYTRHSVCVRKPA